MGFKDGIVKPEPADHDSSCGWARGTASRPGPRAAGQIGDHSFDQRAGSLSGMFDFRHPSKQKLILNPATGAVVSHH